MKKMKGPCWSLKSVAFDLTSDLSWREEPRNCEKNSATDDIFFSSLCSPLSTHRVSGHLPCVNRLSAHIIFSTSAYNWPYVSPAPCHFCRCRRRRDRARSRLRQGDCWMVLPWLCQVGFIFVKGRIWAHRVKRPPTLTLLHYSATFIWLFIHARVRAAKEKKHTHTHISDLMHLSFARSGDVMRYLYPLKWILWSLSCEQKMYSGSSTGPPWRIWIHAPKQHMACGIQWAFINLYICGSGYLHQVRQAECVQTAGTITGWRNVVQTVLNRNLDSV